MFPLIFVLVFGVGWTLSKANAARLFSAWQQWAPNAPSSITSIMKVGPAGNGLIALRCVGQSVGEENELRRELRGMADLLAPSTALSVQKLAFLDAVRHFAGSFTYESLLMKAKSDYVLTPLGAEGVATMMAELAPIAPGGLVLLCDSYGGKVAEVAPDATAFPHRAGAQYCIQYFSSWSRAADTAAHLAQIARVYAATLRSCPAPATSIIAISTSTITLLPIGERIFLDWSR